MHIDVLPAFEYRRERWKNGLGWTREIARGFSPAAVSPQQPMASLADTANGDGWDWRVSIAEIDRDCAFSSFPGIERELVLIAGEGMTLTFAPAAADADGERVELAPPHGRIRFAGERQLQCRLHAGPTRDFNLMWRRARCDAQLLHRPLVGSMLFFGEAGVLWLLHLLSGHATFKDRPELPPLAAGDSAMLRGTAGARVIVDGGGELLLARLSAHDPQHPDPVAAH